MTDTAISNISPLDGVVSKYKDDDFEDMSKGGTFLPRIQLMTAPSEKVKCGDFPANHYALVKSKEDMVDLGKEVDVLVLAWRPTAMDYSGDDFVITHDKESATYQDIQDRADNTKDSKCSWGPEYLLFVSGQGYATFFMGSKSARNEAPGVKAYMHKACTLTSKKIEGKKYTWFCPASQKCSTPFDGYPAKDDLLEQINKFENPPKQAEKEVVETEDAPAGRER